MPSKVSITQERPYRYVPKEKKEQAKASAREEDKKPYKFVPKETSPTPQIKTEEKKFKYAPTEPKSEGSTILIFVSVILILFIISTGIFLYNFMSKAPPPPVIIPPNETNITGNQTNVTVTCDDQCQLEKAVSTQTPDICRNISNVTTSQNCFFLLSNASINACLEMQNKSYLKSCVIYHAKLKKDVKTCNYLKEPDASECLSAVDPCYSKKEYERAICLALARKNYTECDGYNECYYTYSMTTRNADACQALSSEAEQSACSSISLNTDNCADLSERTLRDLCYQIYAVKINDSNKCIKISNDSLYAVECLSYFAISKGDYSVCDAGLEFNNRWSCYTNFSLGTGNVSGCVGIHPLATTAKFNCFFTFGKNFGDPSACDLLGDPGQASTCYVGTIMNNPNLNYTKCAAISVTTWKNKCYTESAKMKNDSSLCDFITTENEKNGCLSAVQ